MPLTAETKAILEARAAAGALAMNEMTPAQAREQMAQMRAMAQVEPEPVAKTDDRTIPGPAGAIPIRCYWPEGHGPFPVLVFYHGGGWVIGDLESHDGVCRMLVNASHCAVVAVDYRLAPEAKYPAAADDCYMATCWVADHAPELHLDASRLAVGGDSAGGNLAAVVAQMARDKGGPQIRAQILIYPVTNFDFGTPSYTDNGEGFGLSQDSMRWFWGHYLPSAEAGAEPYASPLRAARLSGLPPTLIQTAEFDPLRDEGEAYGKALQAAGVPATVTRYDGVVHGFVSQAALVPEGRKAITQIGAELKVALSSARVPERDAYHAEA